MSNVMTIAQLGELLRYIYDNHSPMASFRAGKRMVKYVDPHIDMRTHAVFAITIRGYGWEKTFHTQNESRDLPDSLYERVMKFLKESTLRV